MSNEKSITLRDAVEQVLAQLDAPIAVDEFARRVFAIFPSKAKNPMTALRNNLRWGQNGKTLVYLDSKTIVPLRVALQGVRFRIRLSREEASRGMLLTRPAFDHLLRRGLAPEKVQLIDAAGKPLAVRMMTLKQEIQSLLGSYTQESHALDLSDWFRANRVRRDDSVLVTIADWETGRFRLEHEPVAITHRQREEIERKNQELANLLFDMLENARHEQLYSFQAIPTAYARLSDPRGYPGDHWTEVIDRDPRVKWDGFTIHYPESRTPLERMLLDIYEEEETLPEEEYTPAQARQVFRFKTAFRHRPGLWRRIEIQGEQTLADFDAILRDAFNHDPMDHLSGFWKLVRRGKSKRFREIDLGDIEPFGGGSGADLHVASLGLNPGDELEYVYDFGDWIEHLITLEAITEPEARVKYPRIVEQNKPQYQYCEVCQVKGRKTVATWVCIECSNQQQREVLVCEKCLGAKHEEHYAEEVVY